MGFRRAEAGDRAAGIGRIKIALYEPVDQAVAAQGQTDFGLAGSLFHVAAPYPGTPFFFEVVENGWFRAGTRWEQVDMDRGTVLDYPELPAERLLYWQKRAWREWAFRPGPMLTYIKMLLSDFSTFKSALSVDIQHLEWQSQRDLQSTD